MRTVQRHIEARSRRAAEHPFFSDLRLRPEHDLQRALAFAPVLIPWVMGFQDVIRINASLARDPSIRRKLEHHVTEDRGHELWFLEDLQLVFGDRHRDIAWLYGSETAVTREATLAIASEMFRLQDDRLRLVLIEAIEAGARIFFDRVHEHVEASRDAGKLKYFGREHLQAEAGHEDVGDTSHHRSSDTDLPESVRTEAIAMVDRIFVEFLRMADAARRALAAG